MADYTYATLIVEAAYQQAAQDLFGTDQVFTTGLSADGEPPATHFVSSGPFGNDQLNLALNQTAVPFWVHFGMEADLNGMQIVQEPTPVVEM